MPQAPSLEAVGGANGQVLRDFLAVGHNDDGTVRGGGLAPPAGGADAASPILAAAPDARLGVGVFPAASGLTFPNQVGLEGRGMDAIDVGIPSPVYQPGLSTIS